MNPFAVAANGAWILSSLPAALAFRGNLHRVAEVQEEILLRTVRRNAQTPFGRAHDFASIRTVADYQARVPIRTYDELAPFIEARALTSSNVEHYEPTSGSSGAVKRIPYTRELRAELGRAIAPWIADLAKRNPRAFAGRAYWSLSPVTNDDGFATDEEYLGPVRARLVRAAQAVPSSVRFLRDVDTFRAEMLRHLIAARDLSLISVWHPSFLRLLVEPVLDDIPRLWPHLAAISCWADAASANAAAELATLFPQARIEPKGLLSTEGIVTIPFGDGHALAYRSHFYELRDGDRVVRATEAEAGRRYDVILTTGGGLYRYATEDLVDVIGYRDACPLLRFAGRKTHISDHFGEKLHEVFVRECIAATLASHGATARYATLAFTTDHYELLIDTEGDLDALATALDERLRAAFHYDYCRKLGQLRAVTARRAQEDLIATANGRRLGDVKASALIA